MNAVEIEEAISQLADQSFDAENFPYAFLEAFGNKETTIKRLRAGASNKSDLGGVLQTNNIHIATCDSGEVTKTLAALKQRGKRGHSTLFLLLFLVAPAVSGLRSNQAEPSYEKPDQLNRKEFVD